MEEAKIKSYVDLQKRLEEKGYPVIDKRRISEYINGTATPTFEKARMLLNALEFEMSDEDILYSLKVNQKYNRIIKQNCNCEKELRCSLRIKISKLLPDKNPYETQRYLHDRMKDLFGNENSYTEYITSLIKKDLQEFIISKEESNIPEEIK